MFKYFKNPNQMKLIQNYFKHDEKFKIISRTKNNFEASHFEIPGVFVVNY